MNDNINMDNIKNINNMSDIKNIDNKNIDNINVDNMNDIKTGDVIMTVSDTCGAIISYKSTGKKYNHCGIAVRYLNDKISLTNEGELYIFHMTNYSNKDNINQEKRFLRHTLFSKILKKCRITAYRKLKSEYRNQKLIAHMIKFYDEFKGFTFQYYYKIVSMVFGFKDDSSLINKRITCSEITTRFYMNLINISNVDNEEEKLKILFGVNAYKSPNLFIPGFFSYEYCNDASIFEGEDIIVCSKTDTSMVKASLLLIIIIIFIIIIGFIIKNYIFTSF
jgi:hypothetical protein